MARFGHSLPKEKLGGIGVPSWLPDWLTGKDVREIQGPVYIPPRGKAGGYRKELAADIARKAKDPFTQRDIQSAVIAGADVVPLMGEDVGVRETAEDWKKGDYINAIAGGLGTVLGIAPVVGDVGGKLVKEGGKKLTKGLGEAVEHLPNVEKTASAVVDPVAPQGLGIRAYHGSPHSFEQFDISKIGTGEGAQAYGHGLYFAENRSVAEAYNPSTEQLMAELASGATSPERVEEINRLLDLKADKGFSGPGHMYEVDIAADPDAFLDWDKPLSEQPHLLPAMNQAGYSVPKSADLSYLEKMAAENGPDSWYALQLNAMKPQIGKPASEFVPRTAETAEALKQAGIPGIKYFDQGSRAGGLGSRNYVVFSPELITIVRKYGLAGAIASGVISEEMGRQMQQQGEL